MVGNSFDIVPRRKSAAQASRAFLDQLDSSDSDSQPGRSDGEFKKRKKNVSKKGAASRGGALGKRARPTKPAALTNPITVQGNISPEGHSNPRAPIPKPKRIVKKKSSVPVGAEESIIQANPGHKEFPLLYTTSAERSRKKAKILHHKLSSEDVISDLSSMSSGRSSSEVEILDFTPAPSEHAGSLYTQAVSTGGSKQRVEPVWTSQNLGSYVWVLIEPTTVRVVDPDKDQSRDEYRMWWPGKITSLRPTEIPLRVKLFGQKNVLIHEPSDANIASKLDELGRWRYQSPSFVSSPLRQTASSSGSECHDLEKSREELEGRWKSAVIEMKQAEEAEQDSDYLPDVGEISSWATSGLAQAHGSSEEAKGGKRKGKRKRNELSDEEVLELGDWEPPPHDETLDIPGELVLARVHAGGASAIHNADHWPAKILAYKPPKHAKQQPKYLVKWLDGTEGEISRSCFYTMDVEAFAICKLGAFESSVVEVDNDDEKEDLEVFKARWDFSRRSPSPEAADPAPSMEEFKQKSIRVRFAYTKPVLQAILNKRYEPVTEFHQSFMAGGQRRGRLLEYSSRRGNMDLGEVSELANYLNEWCLRPSITNASHMDRQEDDMQGEVEDAVEQDEVRAEQSLSGRLKDDFAEFPEEECPTPSPPITEVMASSPGEIPPSSSFPVERENSFVEDELVNDTDTVLDVLNDKDSDMISRRVRLPRQQGCEEYETLTDLEKLNYCTTILLPESIRQILLWQNGMRTSFELLSPEMEQELYEKGEALLIESEWVFDVKRMRQNAERVFKRKGTGKRRMAPVDYRD